MELIQTVVPTALFQQLGVGALLDDLAVGQEDDVVGVLHRGEAVRHDQHSADIHELFQRILDECLGLGVDVGGSLVQDHDLGLMHDDPRKGQELSLSRREVVAAIPHRLVQPRRQLIDEVIGVDIAAGLLDLVIRDPLQPQQDIGADGAREQEHVLQHLPEVAAQGGNTVATDVPPVNEDLTLLDVVIAADQGQDGGLSRTGGADEGHGLSRLHLEGHASQHPLIRHIGKPHVAELDLPADVLHVLRVGGIHHLRLHVHDREDLLG